jgi:hypothetical protein
MRICIGILSTRSHRRNDLAVVSRIRIVVLPSIYVPNLTNQLHRAAISEARLPYTDLYAFHGVYIL